MRILDSANINYEVKTYPHKNEALEGKLVAKLCGQNPEHVFKTLVTQANTKEYIVFMLPVENELDLKKGAKAAGVKSIEMIPVKDINKVTGYIRGSTTPLAMKKNYRKFIHETAILYDSILFSGGKIGLQICMNPEDLIALENITVEDITKE